MVLNRALYSLLPIPLWLFPIGYYLLAVIAKTILSKVAAELSHPALPLMRGFLQASAEARASGQLNRSMNIAPESPHLPDRVEVAQHGLEMGTCLHGQGWAREGWSPARHFDGPSMRSLSGPTRAGRHCGVVVASPDPCAGACSRDAGRGARCRGVRGAAPCDQTGR